MPMSKQLLEVDDEDGGGQGPVFVATAAKRLRMSPAAEPTSVLYNRSPSPPTSSSLGGAAGSSSAPELEEPPPISADYWEAVLSGDMPVSTGSQDNNSFLAWIMDAEDDNAFLFGLNKGPVFDPFITAPPPLPPPCQEEPLVLPHQHQQQQQQQQLPVVIAKQDKVEEDYCDLDGEAAVEEVLIEAARRIEAGDSTGARGVLARLNHHLMTTQSPPPPLLRAAAHLRDALLRLLLALPPSSASSSPFDVALKLAAHKALADASPAVQFASITSTQAILDAVAGARRVHLVDLDVGIATHWPPLMQELAHQSSSMPPPAIKLTALVSPGSSAHHPSLELHLVRDSLTRFAAELGIPFQFNAVLFDPSDPLPPKLSAASPPGAEAVAVHLPISAGTLSAASLRVVKQLRPAVVVCVEEDHGGSCHRGDLPLPRHALNVLRSTAAFLDSLDAAAGPTDAVAKIEHFILRPRVEMLLGLVPRDHNQQQLPPWRTMLASAGFAPVQPSSAAEAQAECLLRRTPTRGFHVHKTKDALALRWQRSDLLTVSAWRC